MFTMYDSVTLDEIPAGPHAVAAYINGRYKNLSEAHAKFPHARILSISVEAGDTVADCYDIENGDYAPENIPTLYHTAKAAGVWRPCFYANLSTMPAVKEALNRIENIKREDIRLWVAYYDDIPSLPAGYDAHQFTSRALGRNLDESLCASDFFAPIPHAQAPHIDISPVSEDFTVNYNPGSNEWNIVKK